MDFSRLSGASRAQGLAAGASDGRKNAENPQDSAKSHRFLLRTGTDTPNGNMRYLGHEPENAWTM